MTITSNNYFDLYNLFVNELIGDLWLAVIIGLIIIFVISLKSRVPHEVNVLFAVLWLSIIYATSFIDNIWVLLVMFVGLIFYYRMNKSFQ